VRRPSAARNATHEVLGDNTETSNPLFDAVAFSSQDSQTRSASFANPRCICAAGFRYEAVLDMRKANALSPCLIRAQRGIRELGERLLLCVALRLAPIRTQEFVILE
jgi:hypothetical protein